MSQYATIVADPPWKYAVRNPPAKNSFNRVAAVNHYPLMTNDELAALPIANLAAKDAHLYMWVTNPCLFRGLKSDLGPIDIMEAWGFRYVTMLTWLKQGGLGMGYYFRGETEHVMFGVRGKAPIPKEIRERNWFQAPKKGHSQKPEVFLDIVERVSPAPRLELFARRNRFGWDTWGNQAAEHIEIGEAG